MSGGGVRAALCGAQVVHMEGRPLHGWSFGVVGTVTPLVDLWVEEGRLASYMQAVPKTGGG